MKNWFPFFEIRKFRDGSLCVVWAGSSGNSGRQRWWKWKNKIEYKVAKEDADARHYCILFFRSFYSVFQSPCSQNSSSGPFLLNPIKYYCMDHVEYRSELAFVYIISQFLRLILCPSWQYAPYLSAWKQILFVNLFHKKFLPCSHLHRSNGYISITQFITQ